MVEAHARTAEIDTAYQKLTRKHNRLVEEYQNGDAVSALLSLHQCSDHFSSSYVCFV